MMSTSTRLRGVLRSAGVLWSRPLRSPPAARRRDFDGAPTSDRRHEQRGSLDRRTTPTTTGSQLTIGSKNFTEQFILGEIYAQALEAAGYDVSTDLNLGSEQVALKALAERRDQRLPRVHLDRADVVLRHGPRGRSRATLRRPSTRRQDQFAELGLTAFAPTPFADANAVGLLHVDRRRARRRRRSPTCRASPRT